MNIQFACEMLCLVIVFPLYCKSNRSMRSRLLNSENTSRKFEASKKHNDMPPEKTSGRIIYGFFEPE